MVGAAQEATLQMDTPIITREKTKKITATRLVMMPYLLRLNRRKST